MYKDFNFGSSRAIRSSSAFISSTGDRLVPAPLLVREQQLLTEVLGELRKLLPFPLLGLDTDNDSVFMNESVRNHCEQVGIEFTRCRPYRKNDQAWVEQKNGATCAARSAIATSRGWKPRPRWRDCTPRCGCS